MLLDNRNDFFDGMFHDPFFTRPFENISAQNHIMKTDVHEKDGNYLLEMELPGYQKEDIHAELKDGYLNVSAEHNASTEQKDDKGNCIRSERYAGSCRRTFYVGENVNREEIKASFKDGILSLSVPKKDTKKVEEASRIMIE